MLQCLYFLLMVVGGGFLIVSFLIGAIADWADEVGEGIGNAIEGLIEGLLEALPGMGDITIDIFGEPEIGSSSPSPFNLSVLTGGMTAFGAIGLIATAYFGSSPLVSVIAAVAFGVATGGVVWKALDLIMAQQASSEIKPADYLGTTGVVTVPIPNDGAGVVAITVKGIHETFSARAQSGEAIPAGTSVRIVQKEKRTVWVEETNQQLRR